MDETTRVLIVEDLPTDAELGEREVRQVLPGSEFLRVESREDFLAALETFRPDIILSDYKLPHFDGLAALKLAQERAPDIPFIIVTGSMNEDTAVECMKAGAWDYVIKEHVRRLGQAVLNGLEQKRLRKEKKLAEESLRAREREYRLLSQEFHDLLDAIPDNLVRLDKDLKILWANRAVAADADDMPDRIVGRHCYALWCGATRRCDPCPVVRTFETGKPANMTVTRPDGRIWDLRTFPLIDDDGKILNVVEMKRDLTEHRKLEDQLRQAQKMEAVGTLAGGIAHDFNNALTGIFGFGELLHDRVAGDEEALRDFDEIMRCAERAAKLTRQLLAYSRRQVIEPVHMNLSTLVEGLMKLICKVVGEHIEVKTSLEKNVPTINADHGQIEQVLMNLCLNARDAMPKGGRLVVETGDADLDEEYVRQNPYMRTGRYAVLSVSDTGVGMDEKTRGRVFDPFFTTKGPDQGTGLGLAVVYGIVKQHGGFIHIYSEPGKGSAFKVYLPAIDAPPAAVPESREEEIVRGGKETILLAEDEEAIRVMSERFLKELGYDVLVARNGEEAIDCFIRNGSAGIALAVLDLVMPRKGGKEAFEEMRKLNPALKVIFMSGYSFDGIHGSLGFTAGVPLLQKPFGPTKLARKIREVLDAHD